MSQEGYTCICDDSRDFQPQTKFISHVTCKLIAEYHLAQHAFCNAMGPRFWQGFVRGGEMSAPPSPAPCRCWPIFMMKCSQQRLNECQIDVARRNVETGANVVMNCDDYGHTINNFISQAMWLGFAYSHLKKKIEALHDAGGPALLHSCVHQMPLLKHYVNADLDILQAFQPKAANGLEKSCEATGVRLCIVTGLDIQRGETMTVEDFKNDILRFCRLGRTKPRFILGTTHMLRYIMPNENLRAMFRTVREIQNGEYDN